ncbi:1%2C3-propanediol dehydrogenase [uncultured Flavonifractor sp.]|nr:1%2C3-propanediol dehydrogenase [uncultured Flavonifractor sp.]
MKEFQFTIPQDVIFGKGSFDRLPEILEKLNCKIVLLVSDPGLQKVGLVDRATKLIREAGIQCFEFLDIQANPTVHNVNEAVKAFNECGAESIIALGGGGPMDVAKATGLIATHGGTVIDYVGLEKVPGPVVPMVAIPTTAGTGSEVTASSVITDSETKFKMTVISRYLIPSYALLDPDLIMTLPAGIAAACGVDSFIHAMEAYLSKMGNPFTDAMAEKAMELIGGNIRQFVASRDNAEAACNMMVGSNLAGVAFASALLGNIHAMSHPISGFFGVAHGVANAILMPTIVEYNALADNGRYRKIYDYVTLGKKSDDSFTPDMLVGELRRLNQDLGIPDSLSAVGVTEDKIPEMVTDAMKSGNILRNPRQSTGKDVEMLYRKAL